MERIDNFRRHLGSLSVGRQAEVAEKAKISRIYFNRILRGHAMPSLDVSIRLAEATGYDLGELLGSDLPERV